MKTIKEYSATHSMSTSWFAIDEDGNVAIVNFEHNGPVASPANHDEQCTTSLIETGIVSTTGIIYKNYTDEQIAPMFQEVPDGLNEFHNFKDYFFDCLQIDVARTSEFLEIIRPIINSGEHEVVCFSKTMGIYSSDGLDFNKIVYTRLRESGIVKKVLRTDPIYDTDDVDELASRYPIPFFVYNQEYGACDSADLNKVYTPVVPCVNEKQLSSEDRMLAFRVKGNFGSIDHIQPSIDHPFTTYEYMDEVVIEGQSYYRMRTTGNSDETVYVYDNMFSGLRINEDVCRQCPIFQSYKEDDWKRPKFYSGEEIANHPTVALINDSERLMPNQILHKYPEIVLYSFYAPSIICNAHYHEYSSLYEDAAKIVSELGEEHIFGQHCHNYFEHVLEIFRPYVLILSEQAYKNITSHYQHDATHVLIKGESYSYFQADKIEENYDEILNLAKKPYRGKVIRKVIPVEEAERIGIKHHED